MGKKRVTEVKYSGLAITSMILGIVSLPLFWTVIIPLLALVFGVAAEKDIDVNNKMGRGMALTGIYIGAFICSLYIFFILYILLQGILSI